MPNLGYRKTHAHRDHHRNAVQGEKHYHAHLTDAQVLHIRKTYQGNTRVLADTYKVTLQTIYKIVKGYTYRHLPFSEQSGKIRGKQRKAGRGFFPEEYAIIDYSNH